RAAAGLRFSRATDNPEEIAAPTKVGAPAPTLGHRETNFPIPIIALSCDAGDSSSDVFPRYCLLRSLRVPSRTSSNGLRNVTCECCEFLCETFLRRLVRWPASDARMIQILRNWSGFNLQLLSPHLFSRNIRSPVERRGPRVCDALSNSPNLSSRKTFVTSYRKVWIWIRYERVLLDGVIAFANPTA